MKSLISQFPHILMGSIMNRMSDSENGWHGGIIDGEGTLSIRPRKREKESHLFMMTFEPRVIVHQKDRTILDFLFSSSGLGHVCIHSQKQWRWEISKQWDVLEYLQNISSYLRHPQKIELGKLIIEFLIIKRENKKISKKLTPRMLEIVKQIAFLNRGRNTKKSSSAYIELIGETN